FYGTRRLHENEFAKGPRLALIQGNLDQDIRNEASVSKDMAQEAFDHCTRLCDKAATQEPKPDLIVWPENSFPGSWEEFLSGVPDKYSKELAQRMASRWQTNILLGLETYVKAADDAEEPKEQYNSAVLIVASQNKDGFQGQPAGRYDKIHRVPFGE